MSFSRSIINGMHISALFEYLENANSSLTLLLENPLSHSIRIRPVIKSHKIILVENIMWLRDELEKLDAETRELARSNSLEASDSDLTKRYLEVNDKMKILKEMLIKLLDNDFEDKFVKKLRLDLNDYVTLYVLTKHAKNKLEKLEKLEKLGHVGPDIVLQVITAKNLATTAKEMSNSLASFEPTSTPLTMDVDRENIMKKYIADAIAIFHDIDKYEYIHNLSKNKAGKIIKRRIRKTKRRNINNRNSRNSRNSRKYRKYRNSTRRTH